MFRIDLCAKQQIWIDYLSLIYLSLNWASAQTPTDLRKFLTAQRELTGFSPRIRRIFSSGNIRSNPGKFRSFGPYDITIGALHMVMDVSVTEANLNNASFHWGCNLATHCSVFVQLCLRKEHLFSGVEGRKAAASSKPGRAPLFVQELKKISTWW